MSEPPAPVDAERDPVARASVPTTHELEHARRKALARLNGQAWGISVGLVLAVGLLAATWLLVLRQGPNMGEHLGLLAVFLPGYSVTWIGGLIGFVYLFVIGYALGRLIGWVYNLQVRPDRA